MRAIPWGQHQLNLQEYRVQVRGPAEILVRRINRGDSGTPVFMLPGFLESHKVWADVSGNGLALQLAALGYDVFLGNYRGSDGSWPAASAASTHGLHQTICVDIPAQIAFISKLCHAVPQFWIGHGGGSVLLASSFARLRQESVPVMGMLHLGAGRCCELNSLGKTLRYMVWQWRCWMSRLINGAVRPWVWNGTVQESKTSYLNWRSWHSQAEWLDPEDQYDYRSGLENKKLPPSLYLSLSKSALWGQVSDTRLWLQELGDHNARLMPIGKQSGNLTNYSFRTIGDHPQLQQDLLVEIDSWLKEQETSWHSKYHISAQSG